MGQELSSHPDTTNAGARHTAAYSTALILFRPVVHGMIHDDPPEGEGLEHAAHVMKDPPSASSPERLVPA